MSALLVSPYGLYIKPGLATIGVVSSLKIQTKKIQTKPRHADRLEEISKGPKDMADASLA
jgi:hypothetical protein